MESAKQKREESGRNRTQQNKHRVMSLIKLKVALKNSVTVEQNQKKDLDFNMRQLRSHPFNHLLLLHN